MPNTPPPPSPSAPAPTQTAILRGIRVTTAHPDEIILDGINLEIRPGEFVGIAGETGSGKTTTGMLLLGYLRTGLRLRNGSARIGDQEMLGRSDRELKPIRGARVAYVPQDPATALNPGLRIGNALIEVFRAHGVSDRRQREARIESLFEALELPSDASFRKRYPHQLSGGQQQRVAIAMGFALRPAVIVMDEPTTGLDALAKRQVIGLVQQLSRTEGSIVILISHDMPMLLSSADRILILYAGRIVEDGPAARIREKPRHAYTRALFAALPSAGGAIPAALPGTSPSPAERGRGCDFAPRCCFAVAECSVLLPPVNRFPDGVGVRCLRAEAMEAAVDAAPAPLPGMTSNVPQATPKLLQVRAVSAYHAAIEVTHEIDFDIGAGECLAVVGESGSGKTTVARCIAGLHGDYRGRVLLDQHPVAAAVGGRSREERRAIQYVFQNPHASLNPQRTVGNSIALAAELLDGKSHAEAMTETERMVTTVGLHRHHLTAYPRTLSGGECQRVALARALIVRPRLLVCDEVTASLDISVQAGIIALLRRLQQEHELAMLFITHDVALAAAVSNRVIVLHQGRIVESGTSRTVFDAPTHPYTHRLLLYPTVSMRGDAGQRTLTEKGGLHMPG
jgi:peptide/nickel transport system ATP-binding protein